MNQSADNYATINPIRTLVQCDFDGTVTMEDASFLILDSFARGDWRKLNDDYEAGKMTVGHFNDAAIAMVRATKRAMLEAIQGKITVRPGFIAFVDFCRHNNWRLVLVSNGFEFYIEHILNKIGLTGIEYHAARLRFNGGGRVTSQYIGPDGNPVDDAFKEAFVDTFLKQGYRIVYIGDGSSDFKPARKCQKIFARGTLLQKCEAAGVANTAFGDFLQIIKKLEAGK
jgi:2-hydroxy-3-keto-5-methylthiopentenyl-1-phosphate phosphatase